MQARAVIVGACCWALMACGGRTPSVEGEAGDPSVTPSMPIERDQLLARLAETFCDGIAPCCRESGYAYDSAVCQKAAMASAATKFVQWTTPTASYDAVAAGRCRDALATVLSGCGDLDQDPVYRACYDIFSGTQPPGAACANSSDCARPNGRRAACGFTVLTSTSGGSTMGMCAVEQLHAKAGEACLGICPRGSSFCIDPDGNSAVCYLDDGLYCSFESNVGTCKPVAKLGEACRNGGCVDGTVCEGGFCRAKRDSGSCTDALDACLATSYCDPVSVEPANFQCLPRRTDGDKCAGPDQCLSGYCDMSASIASDGGDVIDPTPGVCAKKTIVSPSSCTGLFN